MIETYLMIGKISTSWKRVYTLQSTMAWPRSLQKLLREAERVQQKKAEGTVIDGN